MAGTATPLVFLPGALEGLEGADRVAERLGADRPLICIAYQPDDTLQRLLGRILSKANEASATHFDLLGQSYGGWIAQCLARIEPERVRRMVLSHSFVLRPGDSWQFQVGSALLKHMPLRLMRPLLLKRVRQALAPLRNADPLLVERQLTALLRDIERPNFRNKLIAQQRCLRQSLKLAAVTDEPGAAGPPVLIIESANDPLIGARQRRALRARHSAAAVHCFVAAGHISAMVETEAHLGIVKSFLDQ